MPRSKNAADIARRRRAERAGRLAERLAEIYLRAQLFRIRARRVKTPVGEIDLVATRGGLTLIVEVKTRRHARLEGETLEAIDTGRLVRAANHYVSRHPRLAETAIRFDVIFLAPFALPRHVRGAFMAE